MSVTLILLPILVEVMKKTLFPSIVLFFFVITGGFLSGQDLPTRKIEDDSALRILLEAAWLKETPARAIGKKSEIHILPGGNRVEVRIESSSQNRDEFAVVLAREKNGAILGGRRVHGF